MRMRRARFDVNRPARLDDGVGDGECVGGVDQAKDQTRVRGLGKAVTDSAYSFV